MKRYEKVFKRYDIRGDYKEEIDELFILTFSKVFSNFVKGRGKEKVILAIDLRPSSPFVKNIFIKGLDFFGIEVWDIGIGSTDYLAVMCKEAGEYGVIITASHHPHKRTGFKIIDPYGKGLRNEELEEIKRMFKEQGVLEQGEVEKIRKKEVEKVNVRYEEASDLYVGKIKEVMKGFGRIEERFVIDLSLSPLAPFFNKIMDLFVTQPEILHNHYCLDLNEEPEPTFESKRRLIEKLKKGEGLVSYDADADRVLFYYNKREYTGDEILYALVMLLKERGCNKVVVSVDISQEVIDKLEQNAVKVLLSRVGDVFVSDMCLKVGCCFSGEPNNHFALSDFSLYNSGFLISLILMANAKKVEQIIRKAGFKERKKEYRIDIEEGKTADIEEVERNLIEKGWEVISRIDGIKAVKNGEGVLIRRSGTKNMWKVLFYYKERIKYEKDILNLLGRKV